MYIDSIRVEKLDFYCWSNTLISDNFSDKKQQHKSRVVVVGYLSYYCVLTYIYFVLGTATSRLTENVMFFVMATPIM